MKIDIKHIAKLSRLKIDDDKLEKFEKDMESIVDMVDKLPEIDDTLSLLDPTEPMKLRKDAAVVNKFKREELLQNAPEVQAGCLVVPKTVE
ncbi:MAG: Asp-tRNA(Asn)/Glu-tRNA(Gln) amidotransferase subunit GatC [Porcipelethomonas sp.]